MAYLQPFLRLNVSGTLYTNERFSWGMTWIDDFGGGVAPEEVPAGVVSAINGFWQLTHISAKAVIDTVKLNLVGTDGRYVDQSNTVLHEMVPPTAGGSSTATPVPQVALAVTLRTGASRGRAHAGRFYLPGPSFSPAADGRITQTQAQTVAADIKTMIDGISTALPGWDPGVVSNVGAGAQKAVTYVSIGRVLDTIRSRRTSLDEDYQDSAPLAAG